MRVLAFIFAMFVFTLSVYPAFSMIEEAEVTVCCMHECQDEEQKSEDTCNDLCNPFNSCKCHVAFVTTLVAEIQVVDVAYGELQASLAQNKGYQVFNSIDRPPRI